MCKNGDDKSEIKHGPIEIWVPGILAAIAWRHPLLCKPPDDPLLELLLGLLGALFEFLELFTVLVKLACKPFTKIVATAIAESVR